MQFEQLKKIIDKIKQDKPIILNITNNVTMDFVANGLLSLGASPLVTKAEQELEDFITLSNVVVINLGTLNSKFIHLCEQACLIANRLKKPLLLDPVGAGASRYRTDTCLQFLMDYDFAAIRGNASEIIAISGIVLTDKVANEAAEHALAIDRARAISSHYDAVVAVSGQHDVIVDGKREKQFYCGSPMMALVTGTGCLLSAVMAAFYAVEEDRYQAVSAAALFYGVCGEMAARKSKGPGTFRPAFLDALNDMPEQVQFEKKHHVEQLVG